MALTVHHQTLRVIFNKETKSLFGTTELFCHATGIPETLALHIYDLDIEGVWVNDKNVEFSLEPSYGEQQLTEDLKLQLRMKDIADYAYSQYNACMKDELDPKLVIRFPELVEDAVLHGTTLTEGQDPKNPSGTEVASAEAPTEAPAISRLVRIVGAPGDGAVEGEQKEYRVKVKYNKSGADSSLVFVDEYLVVDPQLRRARSWFPCCDTDSSVMTFDLLFAVDPEDMVVCSGQLVRQWLEEHPRGLLRHFNYRVQDFPIPPSCLHIAVGPFTAFTAQSLRSSLDTQAPLPQLQGNPRVTYFCPPSLLGPSKVTLRPLILILQLYEQYLAARFPLPYLQVAVVPEGLLVDGVHVGCGCILLGENMLVMDNTVEQSMETRCMLALALARQWFGVLLMPKTSEDTWLMDGLAGHMEGVFIRDIFGYNEWAYRRLEERRALCMVDDGSLAPLCPRTQAKLASQWGAMFGTQVLDPAGPRKWKANAVMAMLEKRIGQASFKRVLEGVILKSKEFKRRLGTRQFFGFIGQREGSAMRKEIQSLGERWVYGRGAPHITAAFAYQKKGNSLQMALRQVVPEACRTSAGKGKESVAAEHGSLKVVVQELEGTTDHSVTLGPNDSLLLEEIKLQSKAGGRRGRKKPGGGEEVEVAASVDENSLKAPIKWITIDPMQEWLADIELLLPECMWSQLLEKSKDVVGQSMAVAALAKMEPTEGIANTLAACLENQDTYCRVRVDAALGLGYTATEATEYRGMHHLLRFFYQRYMDHDTGKVKPNLWADVSEVVVLQAIPVALSYVRDEQGYTPQECLEVILGALVNNNNSGNLYDDSNYLAALVQSLGNCRMAYGALLEQVLDQLDRFLAREGIVPSYQHVVGVACLRAMTSLALAMGDERGGPDDIFPSLKTLLVKYTAPSQPLALQQCAYSCILRLCACQRPQSLDLGLQEGLKCIEQEPSQVLKCSIMQVMFSLVGELDQDQKVPPQVSPETALELYRLLSYHQDTRIRHCAFMLLQRLVREPPTLYRLVEDDEDGGVDGVGQEVSISKGFQTRTRNTRGTLGGHMADGMVRSAGWAPDAPARSSGAPALKVKFLRGLSSKGGLSQLSLGSKGAHPGTTVADEDEVKQEASKLGRPPAAPAASGDGRKSHDGPALSWGKRQARSQRSGGTHSQHSQHSQQGPAVVGEVNSAPGVVIGRTQEPQGEDTPPATMPPPQAKPIQSESSKELPALPSQAPVKPAVSDQAVAPKPVTPDPVTSQMLTTAQAPKSTGRGTPRPPPVPSEEARRIAEEVAASVMGTPVSTLTPIQAPSVSAPAPSPAPAPAPAPAPTPTPTPAPPPSKVKTKRGQARAAKAQLTATAQQIAAEVAAQFAAAEQVASLPPLEKVLAGHQQGDGGAQPPQAIRLQQAQLPSEEKLTVSQHKGETGTTRSEPQARAPPSIPVCDTPDQALPPMEGGLQAAADGLKRSRKEVSELVGGKKRSRLAESRQPPSGNDMADRRLQDAPGTFAATPPPTGAHPTGSTYPQEPGAQPSGITTTSTDVPTTTTGTTQGGAAIKGFKFKIKRPAPSNNPEEPLGDEDAATVKPPKKRLKASSPDSHVPESLPAPALLAPGEKATPSVPPETRAPLAPSSPVGPSPSVRSAVPDISTATAGTFEGSKPGPVKASKGLKVRFTGLGKVAKDWPPDQVKPTQAVPLNLPSERGQERRQGLDQDKGVSADKGEAKNTTHSNLAARQPAPLAAHTAPAAARSSLTPSPGPTALGGRARPLTTDSNAKAPRDQIGAPRSSQTAAEAPARPSSTGPRIPDRPSSRMELIPEPLLDEPIMKRGTAKRKDAGNKRPTGEGQRSAKQDGAVPVGVGAQQSLQAPSPTLEGRSRYAPPGQPTAKSTGSGAGKSTLRLKVKQPSHDN